MYHLCFFALELEIHGTHGTDQCFRWSNRVHLHGTYMGHMGQISMKQKKIFHFTIFKNEKNKKTAT